MRTLAKLSVGCVVLIAFGLVYGGATSAVAQDKKKKAEPKVKVGDKAPSFEGLDENGKTFKSSDVIGKKFIVLYFYPADFTGGCTAQACGFRDGIEQLSKMDAVILGVSGDSVATHKLFKAYHKLPFSLLADEKGKIAKAFGVPVGKGGKSPTIDEKGEKGQADRGVTISRWTIVIDKSGNVAAIDTVGKAGDDAKRVTEIIKGSGEKK